MSFDPLGCSVECSAWHGRVTHVESKAPVQRGYPKGLDAAVREFVLSSHEAGVRKNWTVGFAESRRSSAMRTRRGPCGTGSATTSSATGS